MYFAVLGPLRVTSDDGADVTPSGRVRRVLLATLLVHANRPVRAAALAEAIWPNDTSGRTHARLQLAVHRLRGVFGSPERISHDAGGYRLRVADDEYDVFEFDALAVRILLVEELPPAQTVAIAQEALAFWRGRAFEDVEDVAVTPEAARCEERRKWVVEAWCEAEIARGRQEAVLADLETLAWEQPFHERFQVLLMRALHASGRTAEALEVYTRARTTLQEELGLDPGEELQEEHVRVLAGRPPPGAVRDDVASPAQFPSSPAGLIGREPELAEIDEVMGSGDTRICVVTGTAGVGKTAAALAWAHRRRTDFPDGQLFVDLRGFSDERPTEPIEALAAFLRSLGIDDEGMPPGLAERSALFRSLVAERRVLVLLDNARCSEQVRPLLPGGSSCAVVVTSRETLPGLGARDGATVVELAPLGEDESDRLLATFVGERAEREPAATRAVGRHCGELPLALRIAATQIAARPDRSLGDVVSEIADERGRLDLLDAGEGPATDIRAVLSWSYESLAPEVARVFRLLGLLPGADADDAALSALCACDRRVLRRHLDALARAHLLERSVDGRYRQHDLLRVYAAEVARRVESPRAQVAARSRLLGCYARTAAAAHDVLRPDEQERPDSVPEVGPVMRVSDSSSAQRWLDRERGNVIACVEVAEPADAAQVFALGRAYTPRWRAASDYVRDDGQDADVLRLNARQLDLARAVGDVAAEHAARMGLGAGKANLGDLDGAQAEFSAAVALAAENGDELRRATWGRSPLTGATSRAPPTASPRRSRCSGGTRCAPRRQPVSSTSAAADSAPRIPPRRSDTSTTRSGSAMRRTCRGSESTCWSAWLMRRS